MNGVLPARWRTRLFQGILNALCALVLFVLARALRVLGDIDARFAGELSSLPQGTSYLLRVGERGPALGLALRGGRLVREKRAQADVEIGFKSAAAATRVFVGMSGIAQAYAQHRFTLKGDIALAMPLVRLLDLTEGYLFPRVMTRRFLRAPVLREKPMLYVYARTLLGR